MGDGTTRWYSDPWRLLVGIGAGVVLPFAVLVQLFYHNDLLAIISTGLAVVMLMIGGIGWMRMVAGEKRKGWTPSAMVAFITTEAVVMVGLLMTFWIVRIQSDSWPPEGSPHFTMPVLAMGLLVVASITAGFARRAIFEDDRWGFASLALVTVAIWIVFATITVFRWVELLGASFTFHSNAYGVVVYGITGIHFAHILFGIVILLLALPAALKGRLSRAYTHSMTLYVHYVNVLGLTVLSQVAA